MLFQSLDNKNDCVGVYTDGHMFFDDLPDGLSHTWSWSPYLPEGIEYAQIWVGGKSLGEICPPHLFDYWLESNRRLKAFFRSFSLAKIDLDEHCFFDLVDKSFLKSHCEIKNKICEWVFENYPRPENHDKMVEVLQVLESIKSYEINIDDKTIENERYKENVREFNSKVSKYKRSVDYSIFGSATGRLTTSKKSFPILRLDRKYRNFVKPNNDWFVEFDYNAADIRSLFYIMGKAQPQIDVHQWNVENIFNNNISRDVAKRLIFSWLYDLKKSDKKLEKVYGRDYILREYWDGNSVVNPFGRKLLADKKHAISYLIQSTTADYVSGRMVEVSKILKNLKTRIAFSIHDSIVVDLDWSERHVISDILQCMRQDGFLVSVNTGKNFGSLERLKI